MAERSVLACMRVSETDSPALFSVKRICADCGTEVWVAPSGLVLIERKGLETVCLQCVAADPEDKKLMPIGDEQIAEAKASAIWYREHSN